MSDSLLTLRHAIDSADSAQTLTAAVQALANACLPEAIPDLIAALGYNNPGAAVAAVDGLINLGERSVPAVLAQLDQNNYTARAWAIRVLAGIGDPRGVVTLLGAATADFALSVRRAAARGLGNMQWHRFPPEVLPMVQTEALEALLFVVQHDDEWVVRYAAVVGMEALALAMQTTDPEQYTLIQAVLERLTPEDASPAVQARMQQAQYHLLNAVPTAAVPPEAQPLPNMNWEDVLENLYARKSQERTDLVSLAAP